MKVSLFVVFLAVVSTNPSFATVTLPFFAAKAVIPQLFGLIMFKASLHMLAMNAMRVGWRRQTPHTAPEYERIVEVLDVPEDVYLKKQLGASQPGNIEKEREGESEPQDRLSDRKELIESTAAARKSAWKMLFGNNRYVEHEARPKVRQGKSNDELDGLVE